MAYVPLDHFLVRAPLLPWTRAGDPARRLLRDPLGKLALELASPSLAAHPQGAQARRALARYGRRAAFRPTPAGLLAGVTMGTLAARSGGASGQPRAHWTIPWARLAGLGRALLDDPAIRAQVRLRRAPSLLCGLDRVRWLALGASAAEEREAELDDRLAYILDAAHAWTPWDTVRQVVESYGDPLDGATTDALDELLLLLVDDELLHHDLTPPLVGPPPADWMRERLRRLEPPAPEAALLDQVCGALDSAGRGGGDGGDGVAEARALLAQLPDQRDAGDKDPSALVATLVHQPAHPMTLDRRVVQRAARLAPLIFRLQQALMPPVAERYLDPEPDQAVATATDLYGEGALDLEALALGAYGIDPAPPFDRADPETPPLPAESSAPPAALVRLLVDEIASARATAGEEIALDPAALDQILPALAPPPTCELFLSPTPARTGWLLGLHAPAGATWGRFASALGAPMNAALADLHSVEVQSHPQEIRLDVAYAPSPDLADLCTHPPVRPSVLSLSTWPSPPPPAEAGHADAHEPAGADADPEEAITLAELTLVATPGVDPPALALAPLCVVPSPLTRVRSTTAPPGIFRLLAGFTLHRQFAPWALALGPLADLAQVPRISIDGFVVSPASWRLPARLDARTLRRWRRGQPGVPPPPRFVQVGDQDALLPVDLDAPDALQDLRGQPRAWEIWPPLDAPGIDRDGRRLEAVLALCDQPDAQAVAEANARLRAIVETELVPPPHAVPAAPGWRTFKLFGVEAQQNQVLVAAVRPAVHAARAAGEIDSWFFVRYFDEHERRPHLRVRVHAPDKTPAGARAQLDAFAARLDDALAPARDAGAVALVESGPYHPEAARFGGPDALPAVVRLFEIDSELACALLASSDADAREQRASQDPQDPIEQLVAIFDSTAAGLGLDRAERRELARRRRDAQDAWAAPDSDEQRRARDAEFRQRAPRLRTLLGAPPPGSKLTHLLHLHRETVAECAGALDAGTRARVAAPLLHLAAVRLLGADRDGEARAYRLWERTLEGLLRSPPPPPPGAEPAADSRGARSGNDPHLN